MGSKAQIQGLRNWDRLSTLIDSHSTYLSLSYILTSSPCFSRFNESLAVILDLICISTLRLVSSSELGLIDWSRNARQLLQKVDVQSCFVWRSLFDLLIPFDARFESRISYCRSWAFEFWVRGYNFIGKWSILWFPLKMDLAPMWCNRNASQFRDIGLGTDLKK